MRVDLGSLRMCAELDSNSTSWRRHLGDSEALIFALPSNPHQGDYDKNNDDAGEGEAKKGRTQNIGGPANVGNRGDDNRHIFRCDLKSPRIGQGVFVSLCFDVYPGAVMTNLNYSMQVALTVTTRKRKDYHVAY